ncbi:MAG: acetate--CoA ligase family protein [Anaerolineales bacterium]|nr:MAG: acetate--CoA ligase family protein [Anaerolineales bacterium]
MLETLFSPKSVAVVGASRTQGKLGYAVLSNIIQSGFSGHIYPINPKADEILGLPCYASLDDVEGEIDLAVIVIPAKFVVEVLETCGERNVGSAIVISAGFRETGHEGLMAERKMAELAEKYHMRTVGPNCLGVIDTLTPMNASFAVGMPRQGRIAFMSQSGALCTSILDIALAQEIGFSHFVSLGNKADLNEIDFLQAWAKDSESKVVMAYLEGIADGARFIQTARQLTKHKPIIAIKSGSTSAGSRAVSSHTGTLAGSERAYEAAFKQAGVLRAGSVGELIDLSVALAYQPLPRNEQVAIITNAGGPGIMATDAIERCGLRLASLSQETMDGLRQALPSAASVLNPVDVLGDALADRYRAALQSTATDPNVGALLVILTPQFMTEIEETAHAVREVADHSDIPVLACFMGEANTEAGAKILANHNVPNYVVPERAVAALKAMVDQRQWQERPLPQIETFDVDRERVARIFQRVRTDGRLQIGDAEARDILAAYGIPIPASKLCPTVEEAVAFAEEIGYPVVMKIASPDILHKTDIGGVRLNIESASDVRDSFDLLTFRAMRYMPDAEIWGCLVQQQVRGGKEIITGMNRDPQFGPLVMFGLGGIYVEVLKDVSFRIAPFSRREANEMMREIRSFNLLRGVRGEAPSDIEAISDTLLKVSQLVADFPDIVEMDINPLMAFEKGRGVMGIDMRLVLSP